MKNTVCKDWVVIETIVKHSTKIIRNKWRWRKMEIISSLLQFYTV